MVGDRHSFALRLGCCNLPRMPTLLSVIGLTVAVIASGVVALMWCHTIWAFGVLGLVYGWIGGVLVGRGARYQAALLAVVYVWLLWRGRC